MEPSERSVVLVGGDLLGTDRVLSACRAAGVGFERIAPEGLEERLTAGAPLLVVVDLDGGRDAAVEAVGRARARDLVISPVVGYVSHVDRELAERARAAGIEPLARGRFWNELPGLLGAS